jgi:hypothetical protein
MRLGHFFNLFVVALLFCGELFAGETISWNGENIRGANGNPLSIGSMVQLIKAGNDRTNNPARYYGDGITGDDQVVQTAQIGAEWGGGAGKLTADFSGAERGSIYYVRAWESPPSGELPFQNLNAPEFPATYNDSALWTFAVGSPPFPTDWEFDFDGASGWATTKTALPAPGSSVALTVRNGMSAQLSWTAAGGATSYRVYRTSTNTAPSAGDRIVETTSLNFTDTNSVQGNSYYWVEPVNSAGSGGFSTSQPFRKIVAMPWLNLLLE